VDSTCRIRSAAQQTRNCRSFRPPAVHLTRLAYAHALKANLDVAPLLRKAGLTRQQIDNPALRLSVKSQITFLNLVAAGLRDELFGFHLAHDFDLREIGTLYYIMVLVRDAW
jgi:hypothetical protein